MLYELTLTLRPKFYGLKPQEQFDKSSFILTDALGDFFDEKWTCVAELTNSMNVHYHCLIFLDDINAKKKLYNRFRRKQFNETFGKKTCTQLIDEMAYKKYIQKDLDLTCKYIDLPIVWDGYGIFDKNKIVQERDLDWLKWKLEAIENEIEEYENPDKVRASALQTK